MIGIELNSESEIACSMCARSILSASLGSFIFFNKSELGSHFSSLSVLLCLIQIEIIGAVPPLPTALYQYICDIREGKSLGDECTQFDLLASRDLLRWFGGSEFFGNGCVVLCTWETIYSVKQIAAALGGVRFFLFFVSILYNIITVQYNLIL